MERDIFWNHSGYTSYTFTQEELQFLHDEAEDILLRPYDFIPWNKNLVGQIEKEYRLSDKTRDKLSQLLLPWCESYYNIFPDYPKIREITNLPLKLALDSTWINYQRKYEHNPFHSHSGVFSFVIWLKIPYDLEDEVNTPYFCNSNSTNKPGGFSFYTVNPRGVITETPIQPVVNDALLFPATMKHSVYPFYTSDDYRISVSGNFIYEM